MGIVTNIKNILNRKNVIKSEQLAIDDLLLKNKDNIISDISQRRGLVINSGLSIAERDYILSDSMIASAIQLYVADILSICNRTKGRLISNTSIVEDDSENSKKLERATYIFNQIYSDQLIEDIAINLLNNGEIFLNTKYNETLNNISVAETSYSCCTQLLHEDGDIIGYVVSNSNNDNNNTKYVQYSYNLNNKDAKLVDADSMVRIYNPTLTSSRICIELEEDSNIKDINGGNDCIYYTGSTSLLKQIYPDWLNGKLLELAVYRDRIAKSRYIHLIQLELGRTSRITSDQIYDNVKDYFDKRAVIDLEQQTFKSVVGNEPFTDYKVYTTRNGVGQLTFDNTLANTDSNISGLADLYFNQDKIFAGLGIPKQYLGADDNGSALSNGGSLFFMSEKYQKRVVAYVKRIALGLKQCIKNIMNQQSKDDELFNNWDFDIEFEIPDTNEDIYRVKTARLDYVNNLLDLVDKISQSKDSNGYQYNLDAISNILQDNIKELMDSDDDNK
nr:MAG TPA: capsid assembly protein [Caudoviricetes sp.]